MNGATPVRAVTSLSQARVQVCRRAGLRLPVFSRSSTGGSSPACGWATLTKWSACAIALTVAAASLVPLGRAK